MNILVVGTKALNPIRMGNQRWVAEFIQQLKSKGHKVTYLYVHNRQFRAFSKKKEKQAIEDANKQTVADQQIIFQVPWKDSFKISGYSLINRKFRKGFGKVDNMYPSGLTRFARNIIRDLKIEACVVNYYYLSKLLTKVNVPVKALVTHDSFIYRNKRTGTNTHSLTPNQEAKALQRANKVISLQLEESALFKVLAPESYVATLFMPLNYHPYPVANNHNILYLAGSSEYNVNGIKWFIDKVLPLVNNKIPDAKLIIGGGICNELKKIKASNIELQGFIESPSEFFKQGDISINPVFQGSGLKIKTIESIAYDKITVVNPHSALGLLRVSRNPFVEVETPEEWLWAISKFWNNPEYIEEFKERDKEYCEAINKHISKELDKVFANND